MTQPSNRNFDALLRGERQHRVLPGARAESREDGRIEMSFSSDEPILRTTWWGDKYWEVLDHGPDAVDLARAEAGLPYLFNHNPEQLRGRAESVKNEGGKLRAQVRYGSSPESQQLKQDVTDGISPDTSVGYDVISYVEEKRDGLPLIRITKWVPLEFSTVSVPADPSVGAGRAQGSAAPYAPPSIDSNKPIETESPTTAPTADTRSAPMEPTTPQTPAPTAGADNQRSAAVLGLIELAAAHNIPSERARKWAADGKTVDQAKAELFEDSKRGVTPVSQPSTDAGMSAREAKSYSYARAIAAAAQLAENGSAENSFEVEVSNDLRKKLPVNYAARGGIYVPMRTRAGLDSITGTKGTEIKFTEYGGELIDLLRNASVVARMGAQVLSGLTSPLKFPKQTGAGTASWVGENSGADVAESNLTLGTVDLAPKTLSSTTSYSRQLLAQAVVDVEGLVRNDLAIVHALAYDLAALHGVGAGGEPIGIYSAANVNAVAMGGVPTFAKLVDMVTEVAKDNALFGNTGFVTTPGMAGKMAQTLVAAAAGSDMVWTGAFENGQMAGYKAFASNQVKATLGAGAEHGIIFGNWADMIIGTWGVMELIADPLRLKKQGMIEVTSFQMTDIVLRHPESFCKSTGATLS